MKGTHLGEFEELVLLTVGILYDDAYGLGITDEIEQRTGRMVTVTRNEQDRTKDEGAYHHISYDDSSNRHP